MIFGFQPTSTGQKNPGGPVFFFWPFFANTKQAPPNQPIESRVVLGSYFVQATPRAAPEEEEEEEGKAQGGTTDGERPSVKWREDPEVQEVPEAWRTLVFPGRFLKKQRV